MLEKMGGDRTGQPNIEMTMCVIIHNILIFMVQPVFIAVGVRKFVGYKLISLDWV